MSASADDDGPFQGVVAGDDQIRETIAVLRNEVASLQRLEPLFVEGTAVLRLEIQSLRGELSERPAVAGELPGLKTELRNTLREATEHLRTLVVEEVNELRSELQSVRARLTDRRTEDRADLRTSLAAGSDTLRAALAEDSATVRAEIEAVRAQLKEQQVAHQQLLRAELRAALREWNEHLRTRIVEEATELRSELHQVQGLLAQHEARHGDEGQQLRAIVTAGTENLRAALLAETTSARAALVEHSERLRAEIQAVWAQLNDQHAEERSELGRALGEGTDHLRGSLRREVEAVGAGLVAAQAAAQDELASLRGRVEAFSALFSTAHAAARTDGSELRDQIEALRATVAAAAVATGEESGAVRMLLDALGMDVTSAQLATRDEAAAVRTGLHEVAAAVAAARDEAASLRARLDELASTGLTPVRAQLEALAAALPVGQNAAREEARAALTEHADQVRSEVQAVWAQLNDQHTAERVELLDSLREGTEQLQMSALESNEVLLSTLREGSEQLRASLLVELTEFLQSQIDELARTGKASLAEQVELLRAAMNDAERQARRERLQHEVTVTAERLTGLQLELTAWREQATDERAAEVDALLAAVAGNEERLHQLVTDLLAAADRRRTEDSEATRAAFTAATEERQAQLAYLEQVLQTFNQALALNRQEMQALVTWNYEATDASVSQLGADLAGRLDALGSMASRLLAGEGVLEVGEAVAALRADLARINRKLPAKPKAGAEEAPHTAKRSPRTAPSARGRRPTRPS